MSTLRGKRFVVTGGSGNLGHSTVHALLARGAKLVVLDRDDSRPRAAFADAIEDGRLLTARVDLTDANAVDKDVNALLDSLDGVDGLVATVGGYKGGVSVLDSSWSDWEAMWRINVAAALHVTRAVVPRLVAQRAGAIVHVASLAALSGEKNQVAYSASKSALLRLTEGLAEELKPHRVRVNAVLPGTMDTKENRSWMSPEFAELAIDTLAVADAIGFLLSDDARAVTGDALRVTGFQ